MIARPLVLASLITVFSLGFSLQRAAADDTAEAAETPAEAVAGDEVEVEEEPIYVYRGQLMSEEEREAHYEHIKGLSDRSGWTRRPRLSTHVWLGDGPGGRWR